MIVQVNDPLCFDTPEGVEFTKVKEVKRKGWILTENGTALNVDILTRPTRDIGFYVLRIPTADDFRKHRRRVNATELDRASRMVREYTDEQLQKIADCIREVTGGKE
jgi:hypothetical protein